MESPSGRHWVLGSVGVAMLGLIGYFGQAKIQAGKSPSAQPLAKLTTKVAPPKPAPKVILVEIRGAVNKPGVYEVAEGTRTRDLFAKAGGLTESADTTDVNQVRILRDGNRIDVPDKRAKKPPVAKPTRALSSKRSKVASSSTQNNLTTDQKESHWATEQVSINHASVEELAKVRGMGRTLAENIVVRRATNGAFLSIEELLEVPGIGKSKLEALKKWLTL